MAEPTPYRDAVRRAFGRSLGNQAVLLALVDHALVMVLKGDQVRALTEQERKRIRDARNDIGRARKLTARVAKGIANETS